MSQTVEPCDESDPRRESRSNPEDEDGRCTLDGLLLHMFHLLEDLELLHTQVNKESSRAQLLLARVRLHQSALRIPAEAQLPRGRPYKALTRVVEERSSWGKVFKIIRLPVNPILGYLRPVRNIFGSLVPDNLRIANRHWEHCLDLIVECANIKRELQSTIIFIEKLRYFLNQR
ncbi:uncharacterized protein LOC6534100 [Drosophila yakuba]|uniref:Vacuolar ATPase assembly protein VMA22 n=1 Tax=Drosophila yakuba TaxID=7245 RepID=B4PI23_DROYA|nr:uncharacterized protein LOC6534100 [Drosophila yakuba]EDW94498.1 uncharacterized protein Dyak_GE22014 [Drosophila yakuba]